MYRYKATVTDVYDADTITVDVDLGFHAVLRKIKVRLHGINAPEMLAALIGEPDGSRGSGWKHRMPLQPTAHLGPPENSQYQRAWER